MWVVSGGLGTTGLNNIPKSVPTNQSVGGLLREYQTWSERWTLENCITIPASDVEVSNGSCGSCFASSNSSLSLSSVGLSVPTINTLRSIK